MTDRAREVIGWAGPAAVHVDTETGVARFHVNEFLAALEAEGLAVVPVEPTEAMRHAGRIAVDNGIKYVGLAPGPIYRAMIRAAKEKSHDDG